MTKRVVVQPDQKRGIPIGSITWEEYWFAWVAKRGTDKTEEAAMRFAQEGGFTHRELCRLLDHEPRTWKPVDGSDNLEK